MFNSTDRTRVGFLTKETFSSSSSSTVVFTFSKGIKTPPSIVKLTPKFIANSSSSPVQKVTPLREKLLMSH